MSNYIYTNGQLYTTDELKHYGVLGMKWGVRKKRDDEYANIRSNTSKRKTEKRTITSNFQTYRTKRRAITRSTLNRYGGSKGKAIGITALKTVGSIGGITAGVIGANIAALMLSKKSLAPMALGQAIAVGGKAVSAILAVKGAVNITELAVYKKQH